MSHAAHIIVVALAVAAFVMLVVTTAYLKHIRMEIETIVNRMEIRK